MGIITKEVEVRLNANNVNHYRKLGYDIPMKEASQSMRYQGVDYVADFQKTILIKIEDLPLNSRAFVETICDYCGEPKPLMRYSDYNKQTKNNSLKCCCEKCASIKQREIIFEKYGYKSVMQVPEIKERVSQTNLAKYGYTTPSQSQEVRKKMAQTFYANSSQKASKQQRYINNLYQGILNFPVKFYCTDICLPDDNIVIEFDGSGHALNVVMGRETIEEYNHKEIVRHMVIKTEGYQQMRIISSKDLLPSDSILLQMLSEAKQYFSKYPNHSWIEFDIDSSTIRNAENKDGISYNYGKLRKIKDSNLYESAI